MKGRLEVRRSNFWDFGHFGSFLAFLTDDLSLFLIKFWSILAILGDFGSVWGPGGSGEMVEGPGKGQLGAWQGPGMGQGPRSGRALGRILVILGPRGQNLGSGSKFGGQGQNLRARGQNLGSEVRFWSFWVIFGTLSRIRKIRPCLRDPLKKMALRQGILTRIWTGGSFWGQKFD